MAGGKTTRFFREKLRKGWKFPHDLCYNKLMPSEKAFFGESYSPKIGRKHEMQRFRSESEAATEAIGEALAAQLSAGEIVAFRGGLGMGKTAFTRGLARGLGSPAAVSSPTFALLQEYRGGRLPLCHMDAYRLQSAEALLETGFYDYLDAGWVAAVEWSENVPLEPAVTVTIARIDDDTREITLEGKTI